MDYRYFEKFVVRTPLLPLEQLHEVLHDDVEQAINNIFDFFKDPLPQEALFLASPALYDRLALYLSGELQEPELKKSLAYSLTKYFIRMTTRPTPFGLFAGCSIGQIGLKNQIIVNGSLKGNRHTRLDMNYLCALADSLSKEPEIRKKIKFFSNKDAYTIGETIRYIEYYYHGTKRVHRISGINNSTYVQQILERAKWGAGHQELVNVLLEDGNEHEQASAFIDEMIDSQVLVHELEPSVSGDEFFHQIISVLTKLPGDLNIHRGKEQMTMDVLIKKLQATNAKLNTFDNQDFSPVSAYKKFAADLAQFDIAFDENKLLQSDLTKKTSSCELDRSILKDIKEGLAFLNKISIRASNKTLDKFKKAFQERFETKEVPLLYALDVETGIGYHQPETDNQNENILWSKWDAFLLKKLLQCREERLDAIYLTEEDGEPFTENWQDQQDTMPCMFQLVNMDGKTHTVIQGAGGSSAANMLARFCHASEEMHDFVKDIVSKEEEMKDEHSILAEIIHLPESRMGNILLRPALRPYEIAYLAKSSLPQQHQILLDDLFISVVNDKVVLRSKSLNKIVIPRLTTAHNFFHNSLPVYHFLCDLQTQDSRGAVWFSWGHLENTYQRLPRVYYKNVIISTAKWVLEKKDYQSIIKANISKQQAMFEIRKWREQWMIPRHISLGDSDNELYIDLENTLCVMMFIDMIRKRDVITLVEFLYPTHGSVAQDQNQANYVNQFVVAFHRNGNALKKYNEEFLKQGATSATRDFIVGQEWLYYKLYCGPQAGDQLLRSTIHELIEVLLKKGWIDSWFFLRYGDPKFHLRIRFHTTDLKNIPFIINEMTSACAELIGQGTIWKVQIDTYSRELERYGNNTIEQSEKMFNINSDMVIKFLGALEDQDEATEVEIKWFFGLKGIDNLLNHFKLTLAEKKDVIGFLAEGFGKEFNMDSALRKQTGDRFRKERAVIESIIEEQSIDERFILYFDIFKQYAKEYQLLAEDLLGKQARQELDVDLNSLLGSYLHMFMNRLFSSDQRFQEMWQYQILWHFYRSQIARSK